MKELYSRIGTKIKYLAFSCFLIGAGYSFICGYDVMQYGGKAVLQGIIIFLIGAVISFVSSWLLYGFGEIIDKLTDIEKNTRTNKQDSVDEDFEQESQLETNKRRKNAIEEDIVFLVFVAVVIIGLFAVIFLL